MFKRNKGEILNMMVRLYVIQEPSEPGGTVLRVRPNRDILIDALEYGPAQLYLRSDLMDRVGKLNRGRVIFRQNVLAIASSPSPPRRLGTRVSSNKNLIRGIFRRAEEDCDGNHRGQIVGNAAGEEKVETRLIAALVQIRGRVVGIGRRAIGWRLCRVR